MSDVLYAYLMTVWVISTEENKIMYQELPEHTESYLASLVVLSFVALALIFLFTMTPM